MLDNYFFSDSIHQKSEALAWLKYMESNIKSQRFSSKTYDIDSAPTVLETITSLLSFFAQNPTMSKASLSQILHREKHELLPPNNNHPGSYKELIDIVKYILPELTIYDVCVNDCIMFRESPREDFLLLKECPECHEPRNNSAGHARKKFAYFTLESRIRRMFSTTAGSSKLQDHAKSSVCNPPKDYHESKSFRSLFKKEGCFKGDSRGLAMQLAADGVQPFDHSKQSLTPAVAQFLNMSATERVKPENMHLFGIIPSYNGHGPKSLNVYMDLIADEVDYINATIYAYDALTRETFKVCVTIHGYVMDYPGFNKMFNALGSAALQGCMWCTIRGKDF